MFTIFYIVPFGLKKRDIGEEFAVILRNASKRGIISVAERILYPINSEPSVIYGKNIPLTVSTEWIV